MRKSLFRKYFTLTVSIVIISFTVLGILLMAFMRDFWVEDRLTRLRESAVEAASLARNMLASGYSSTDISGNLRVLAGVVDADIYIVSPKGEHYICSAADSWGECHHQGRVPEAIVAKAIKGEYNSVGFMGSLYTTSHYTVGVPFLGPDSKSTVLGAVFASSPSDQITRFILDVFRMFTLAAVMVVLVVFIAVWVITSRMTMPLRQMAAAACAMAEGDFSRHIYVNRDDEIGELAAAFNEMTSSLASLEQMRRSFIGNISHELKTPMTTIAGFIDGILDGTIDKEEQNRYLAVVSDEIKRLSRLANSMLSLSKLEAGEMKINPAKCDLQEILVRIMLSQEKRIQEKNLKIEGLEQIESTYVTADPDLIHQVIYNLVDNAIKFTPENGEIKFRVTESEREVVMVIRNTGSGIDPKELPYIFERFYKTDKSRSVDKSGTGLGLYIVKTIINIHGGRITARSSVNEYTEFEFSLPKI